MNVQTPSEPGILQMLTHLTGATPARSIYAEMPAGTRVYSRKTKGEKQKAGITTGALHRCRLEGCTGFRVTVKWPNGRITHPCSKGLLDRKGGGFEVG
jgi:hypothetical protein